MANVVENLEVISNDVKRVKPDVCQKMQNNLKYITKGQEIELFHNHTVDILQNVVGKVETDFSGRCQISVESRVGQVELLSITLTNRLKLINVSNELEKTLIFETLKDGGSIVGHLSC